MEDPFPVDSLGIIIIQYLSMDTIKRPRSRGIFSRKVGRWQRVYREKRQRNKGAKAFLRYLVKNSLSEPFGDGVHGEAGGGEGG